ncbi:MAG: hypothetical protein HC794_04785 [Nitrospiraceae bacterium]|nr:hypothetical protein [Nitrospiraceae bacterium]
MSSSGPKSSRKSRNAPGRYRGFLASCMLELAPGVYTSPQMSEAVIAATDRFAARY